MKDDKIKFAEGVELIESLDVSDSAKDLFYERILNEGLGDVAKGATGAVGGVKDSIVAKYAKMAQKQAAKKVGDVTKMYNTVHQCLQGMLKVIEINATFQEEQKAKDKAIIQKYLTEIETLTKSVIDKQSKLDAIKNKVTAENPQIKEKEKEAEVAGQSMSDATDKVGAVSDVTTMGTAIEALGACVQKAPEDDESLAALVETLQAKVEDISAKEVDAINKQIELLNGYAKQSAANAPRFADACKELADALQRKLNAPEEPVDETEEPVDETEEPVDKTEEPDDPESDGDTRSKEDVQKELDATRERFNKMKDEAAELNTELSPVTKERMEDEIHKLEDELNTCHDSISPENYKRLMGRLNNLKESIDRIRSQFKHLR